MDLHLLIMIHLGEGGKIREVLYFVQDSMCNNINQKAILFSFQSVLSLLMSKLSKRNRLLMKQDRMKKYKRLHMTTTQLCMTS